MFTRCDRELLQAIYATLVKLSPEISYMALNFANLQAAVTQLTADVNTLIAAFQSGNAPAQAQIDAVTASLAAIDAAVNTADGNVPTGATGPAAPTGATGP